jgi:hypothetical protein
LTEGLLPHKASIGLAKRIDRYRLKIQINLAFFKFDQIQNVGNQFQQMITTGFNASEGFNLLRIDGA